MTNNKFGNVRNITPPEHQKELKFEWNRKIRHP